MSGFSPTMSQVWLLDLLHQKVHQIVWVEVDLKSPKHLEAVYLDSENNKVEQQDVWDDPDQYRIVFGSKQQAEARLQELIPH